MQIVIPKRYPALTPNTLIIFLAGPVLGGGDWQAQLIKAFIARAMQSWPTSFYDRVCKDILFVVPCRWTEDHELASHFVQVYEEMPKSDHVTSSQTCWETWFLSGLAGGKVTGLIVFGLFPESKDNPRSDGTPYAIDTYGEFARYHQMMNSSGDRDSIFTGVHPNFPVGSMLKNLRIYHGEDFVEGPGSCVKRVVSPEDLADKLCAHLYLGLRKSS